MTNNHDDNELPPGTRNPDSHGQAAMLLVESLIHGLIAKSVIGVADALEIIDIAVEVKEDVGEALGAPPQALSETVALLNAIASSLKQDLPD